MTTDIELGERIARWRAARGLTQCCLADLIEEHGGQCSPSALAQWELNQTSPTHANLQAMTEALEITLSQFWGRIPAPKKKRAA